MYFNYNLTKKSSITAECMNSSKYTTRFMFVLYTVALNPETIAGTNIYLEF